MMPPRTASPSATRVQSAQNGAAQRPVAGSLERQLAERCQALQRALDESPDTRESILDALAGAFDMHGKETQGHSRRVAEYATTLALKLGMAGEQLKTLRHGALLHDVGKLGVPDEVLHKPAGLNEEEWAQIRKHPEIGFSLLKDIEFLCQAVATVVLHHHERFDGSGYPSGLMEGEIPVGARVFAVADTLDALTTPRPYRPARSYAAARVEIHRHSGRQFDPQVVEAYMAIPDRHWRTISASVDDLIS